MCACVCVCQCRHTHTPLSLSHYQLAFHPVSHPSVQMVRKAASMLSLSPSSLYTLLWRKKIRLCQRSTEAKQGRDADWMSGGLHCKWSSQRVKTESRSVSTPVQSVSIFCLIQNSDKTIRTEVPLILFIIRGEKCQRADSPESAPRGVIPKAGQFNVKWFAFSECKYPQKMKKA